MYYWGPPRALSLGLRNPQVAELEGLSPMLCHDVQHRDPQTMHCRHALRLREMKQWHKAQKHTDGCVVFGPVSHNTLKF